LIFKHRQNNNEEWSNDVGAEFDVRLSAHNNLVLSHDPITWDINLDVAAAVGEVMYKRCEMPKTSIVNVKTSGAEELAADLFSVISYEDFYFLDSQIPDILRLSKLDEYKGKFIIRVSDVESWNQKLIDVAKPKYIWADWSSFDNFEEDKYRKFINTLTRQISDDQELIIVSPELYSLDYEHLIPTIAEIITYYGHSSVCTKTETKWEALLAKSK
jgi:glycerophosphoryl diester phosphodiesterase